jgi:arylsulfatase
MLIDLRSDPFERAPIGSSYYDDWSAHRMFVLVPVQAFVAKWISSFQEFPPRQKPASFSIDEVMNTLKAGPRSK